MWHDNCTNKSSSEPFTVVLELVGFEKQLVNWLTSVLSGLCPCSTAGNGAQTSRRPLLSTSKSNYILFMLAFLLYYYHQFFIMIYYYYVCFFPYILFSSLSCQLGLQYLLYFIIIIMIIIIISLLISIWRPPKYMQCSVFSAAVLGKQTIPLHLVKHSNLPAIFWWPEIAVGYFC